MRSSAVSKEDRADGIYRVYRSGVVVRDEADAGQMDYEVRACVLSIVAIIESGRSKSNSGCTARMTS